MKVTLFLMTLKGYEVIRSVANGANCGYIEKVVIGRDNNVTNDYSRDIEQICVEHEIPFCFNNENYQIDTVFGIAISWRWLINKEGLKLIVLHDSILPKYRGFAPLVSMLINGEKKIGVTALFASAEFDRGPIVLQQEIDVCYPIKIETAIEEISVLYTDIVNKILYNFVSEIPIQGEEQDDKMASYSLWRDKEDYYIKWELSSSKISRFVDAVGYPYDGAKCFIDNVVVKIIDCEVFEDLKIENRDLGKILFFVDEFPIVVCGTGLIKINKAIYESTGESIFPLKKYRIRFT